jgi:hypothetical protein
VSWRRYGGSAARLRAEDICGQRTGFSPVEIFPDAPESGLILPIPAKSGFPSRESKPRIPAAGQIGIGGPPGGGKSRNPAGGQNWDGGKIPNIFRTPAESGFKSGKISFFATASLSTVKVHTASALPAAAGHG